MKILIAPDKFKGSLSAQEVCEAIGKGLVEGNSNVEVIAHPLADGGDGSLEVLAQHLHLRRHLVETIDPLGRSLTTDYFTDETTAFIELASSSGLVLLEKSERSPMITSTKGTGKMIVDAINKGYQNISLFLGGSATNDAGIGIAHALGFRFYNSRMEALEPIGANLIHIQTIKDESIIDLGHINFTLLCDVNNPLHGPNGAAHVYAKQKGASPSQIELLDSGLRHYGSILQLETETDITRVPGIGAAGGIGASLLALCNAEVKSGFETLSLLTGLTDEIMDSDLVISGEGKIDLQSVQGKVVSGLAKMCQQAQKPLVLFVGKNELDQKTSHSLGIQNIYSVFDRAQDIEDSIDRAAQHLYDMSVDFASSLPASGHPNSRRIS